LGLVAVVEEHFYLLLPLVLTVLFGFFHARRAFPLSSV